MGLFGGGSEGDLQRRVEELERRVAALERVVGHAVPPRPVGTANETWASATVRDLAFQGKKIQAIKVLREETGLTLKEAKDIVDRLG
ncbi:MAG: ribosomal protein L7/L12 [Mycolicibacterium cosmeticum]|nr:ribosomal protein L7/L12 [Mycolicibacterium cosmeticum]